MGLVTCVVLLASGQSLFRWAPDFVIAKWAALDSRHDNWVTGEIRAELDRRMLGGNLSAGSVEVLLHRQMPSVSTDGIWIPDVWPAGRGVRIACPKSIDLLVPRDLTMEFVLGKHIADSKCRIRSASNSLLEQDPADSDPVVFPAFDITPEQLLPAEVVQLVVRDPVTGEIITSYTTPIRTKPIKTLDSIMTGYTAVARSEVRLCVYESATVLVVEVDCEEIPMGTLLGLDVSILGSDGEKIVVREFASVVESSVGSILFRDTLTDREIGMLRKIGMTDLRAGVVGSPEIAMLKTRGPGMYLKCDIALSLFVSDQWGCIESGFVEGKNDSESER